MKGGGSGSGGCRGDGGGSSVWQRGRHAGGEGGGRGGRKMRDKTGNSVVAAGCFRRKKERG